eukprot:TRINITY_DN30981_c0_g1_i1.p3 TRINITY_DN30981_c0_g1~~TRINITY_DN30981_c0_g1_i1.p3  ORF type:complete len:178 (+),score=64.52 TRINITY_DN30981_c0_g1_i1:198-731(+)
MPVSRILLPRVPMKKTDSPKTKSLSATRLRAVLDPARVAYADSDAIPDRNVYPRFQPRAIQALSLALEIKGNEHNVYVSGEPNMGRTYFVKSFLKPAAAKSETPRDWLYLYNFEDSDRPIAVSLPAGTGRKFKQAQQKAMTLIRQEIPGRFEKDAFQKKKKKKKKKNKRKKTAPHSK